MDDNVKHDVISTIKKDAEFLAKINIIDYSLLIGVIDNEEQDSNEEVLYQSRSVAQSHLNGQEFKVNFWTNNRTIRVCVLTLQTGKILT